MSTPRTKRDFAAAAPIDLDHFVPSKLWKDRGEGEYANPPEFVHKIYTRVLGQPPERRFIRKHDKSLYFAYSQHVGRYPEDDVLPKMKRTTWDERLGVKLDPKTKNFDQLVAKLKRGMSKEDRYRFEAAVRHRRHQM